MSSVVVSETNGNVVVTTATTSVISVSEVNVKNLANMDEISLSNDSKIIFDGSGGNTYLKYNSGSGAVELYVDGVQKAEWG